MVKIKSVKESLAAVEFHHAEQFLWRWLLGEQRHEYGKVGARDIPRATVLASNSVLQVLQEHKLVLRLPFELRVFQALMTVLDQADEELPREVGEDQVLVVGAQESREPLAQ